MMIYQEPPKTPGAQLLQRMGEVWRFHPQCQLAVGEIGPAGEVMSGEACIVAIAKGPLMIFRYPKAQALRFLFDAYGS